MFLAHFSNTPLSELAEWPVRDLVREYMSAIKVHKQINNPNG